MELYKSKSTYILSLFLIRRWRTFTLHDNTYEIIGDQRLGDGRHLWNFPAFRHPGTVRYGNGCG